MCSYNRVRWDAQQVDTETAGTLPGLERLSGFVRTVRTPDFAGMTFHEVLARSALNKVSSRAAVPFPWTVNPYRGCSHACVYCFARPTHDYLGLDIGTGFDTEIVVKTNIAQVLAKELAAPRWQRETVAMGTNTDPYQRAEGRYRLMPGVIAALADHRTPFSILTKGTLLTRDLPLLASVSGRVEVSLGVSVAMVDKLVQTALEPGAPSVEARLQLIRKIRQTGLSCMVLMAPILPYLTDSEPQMTAAIEALVDAGASTITPIVLHLRPGVREWFFGWLRSHRPDLIAGYERLYRRGTNADPLYRQQIIERVNRIKAAAGCAPAAGPNWRNRREASRPAEPGPPSLFPL